jgi:hypothetical protein
MRTIDRRPIVLHPQVGWRYFLPDHESTWNVWAWDPVHKEAYWEQLDGSHTPSFTTLETWLQAWGQNSELMVVDPDLVMDEGL